MVVCSNRPYEPVSTKGRNSYSVLTWLGNKQIGVLCLTIYKVFGVINQLIHTFEMHSQSTWIHCARNERFISLNVKWEICFFKSKVRKKKIGKFLHKLVHELGLITINRSERRHSIMDNNLRHAYLLVVSTGWTSLKVQILFTKIPHSKRLLNPVHYWHAAVCKPLIVRSLE